LTYNDLVFKIPEESKSYFPDSEMVVRSIESILKQQIESGNNKIILNTNLKYGLPMENINKIAGPIIEAWAYEIFCDIKNVPENKYCLVNVEARPRLDMADVLLQFENKNKEPVTANVDVKATAEDIENSGKSPNITSFSRIRTAYINDPDYMFIVLSLKHKVYSKQNTESKLIDGVMEVVKYNAYDLKYISDNDISYNPALGTGQIQIKDIHYISLQKRTAWEFCRLLDEKYLSSGRKTFEDWYREAIKHKWIKD
jgi:hypothetical protein